MESGLTGAGDPSAHTDAAEGPATHKTVKLVAGMFLAALALFAFQLVRAQTSSAATGVACSQTGTESAWTDRSSYAPGSVVHVFGLGYAVGCDVVVKVTRPDGSVVVGDGSQASGSDTVTTDLAGNSRIPPHSRTA